MRGPVVVAGEALMDLVRNPEGTLSAIMGGGPFNTARTLGRLGCETAFIGALSRDRFGVQLAAALAADGVSHEEGLRTDRPTSLAMAEVGEHGAASYRFYFAGTSAEDVAPSAAIEAMPPHASALHVGGLGLVLEPMAHAVEALVAGVSHETLVMLDPNIRPALPGDRARLERVMSRADVLKVSEDDLALLWPDRPPMVSARALQGGTDRLVLLTLGAEGAVALGAFGERAIQSSAVDVIDTIGAGDVFSGAWLSRWVHMGADLHDGEAVQAATVFACRAAAWSCSQPGAIPPSLTDLEGD